MPEKTHKERIIGSEPLFDGGFLHAEKLTVLLPNGKTALREVTRHRGAVAVVPIWPDGSVTIVRQFRPAIDQESIEVPAGLLDPNEDRLTAAKRELEEETGLLAENWYELATVASSPGCSDEKVTLFAATKLSGGKMHLDEDEFLVAQRIPLEELHAMICSGQTLNASTVAAVLLAMEKIRSGEIVC